MTSQGISDDGIYASPVEVDFKRSLGWQNAGDGQDERKSDPVPHTLIVLPWSSAVPLIQASQTCWFDDIFTSRVRIMMIPTMFGRPS